MNKINCEDVLMAKMAELDAEKPELSGEQINLHLKHCENCHTEIEQFLNADTLLKRQARNQQDLDLWLAVEKHIGSHLKSEIGWRPFALLGALLVAFKLLEMLPDRDFGLAFKLVPLVFVVALFVLIRENPFRINAELVLER